jgi:hypothetical protein
MSAAVTGFAASSHRHRLSGSRIIGNLLPSATHRNSFSRPAILEKQHTERIVGADNRLTCKHVALRARSWQADLCTNQQLFALCDAAGRHKEAGKASDRKYSAR